MFALGTLFGQIIAIFYPMPINRQGTKEGTPSASHNRPSVPCKLINSCGLLTKGDHCKGHPACYE